MLPSLCITSLSLEHLGKILFFSGEWLPTNQAADYKLLLFQIGHLPLTGEQCAKRKHRTRGNHDFGPKAEGTKCERWKGSFTLLFCSFWFLSNEWAVNWMDPTLEAHPHCSDTGHIQYPKPNMPMFVCLPCRKSKLFINNANLFHSIFKLNFHWKHDQSVNASSLFFKLKPRNCKIKPYNCMYQPGSSFLSRKCWIHTQNTLLQETLWDFEGEKPEIIFIQDGSSGPPSPTTLHHFSTAQARRKGLHTHSWWC